jgi:hypothetical protein
VIGDDLLGASIDRIEDREKGLVKKMNDAYGPCFDAANSMHFIPGGSSSGSLPDLIAFSVE